MPTPTQAPGVDRRYKPRTQAPHADRSTALNSSPDAHRRTRPRPTHRTRTGGTHPALKRPTQTAVPHWAQTPTRTGVPTPDAHTHADRRYRPHVQAPHPDRRYPPSALPRPGPTAGGRAGHRRGGGGARTQAPTGTGGTVLDSSPHVHWRTRPRPAPTRTGGTNPPLKHPTRIGEPRPALTPPVQAPCSGGRSVSGAVPGPCPVRTRPAARAALARRCGRRPRCPGTARTARA